MKNLVSVFFGFVLIFNFLSCNEDDTLVGNSDIETPSVNTNKVSEELKFFDITINDVKIIDFNSKEGNLVSGLVSNLNISNLNFEELNKLTFNGTEVQLYSIPFEDGSKKLFIYDLNGNYKFAFA